MITCSIFLDLAKAFNSISHKILIDKLKNYEIRQLLLQLFKSYLSNDKEYTVFNTQSSLNNVTCGIPQGSTLAPLLFITYINDLPLVSSFRTSLFVNDTNLTISGKDSDLLQNEVNLQLLKIENWMKINKSITNYETEFMLVTKKKIRVLMSK